MKRYLEVTAVAALLAASVLSSAQAGVVVGTTDTNPFHSNAAPFGNLQASYFYQQVYDDSAFSGPLTISQLTFYNTVFPGGTPNPGAFQIYLETTSQQVGAITDNIPSGLATATLVYDGDIPLVVDGRIDFALSQSFFYDPTLGDNLLLIVKNFNFIASPSPMYLDSDTTAAVTSSRHYSGPNGPSGNLRSGLITGFNDVAAVPEPASWSIALFGLLAVGFTHRRKPNASAAIA